MPIEPAQTLLHYRLIEKLGEGGMGVVWRAIDTTLDREVAVKILPDSFAESHDRLSRFDREARLLASLNHPNIASIYGMHVVGTRHFLAMELVDGEDLSTRLLRGALPLDEALEIARQIAEALEAAHDRGVIHRDLKPANIKLATDDTVKVLDFGLAKALDPAGISGSPDPTVSPAVTSVATVAGMILGTAAYMSPEQARGKRLDRRTDLWSFGCVLYEMVTGKQAFGGETVTDLLSAVISREPDRTLLPSVAPPSLHRLLDRCLTKDARARLGDAGAARLEIDDALRELREPSKTTAVTSQRAGSWLPWGVAALALLVALVVWGMGGAGWGRDTAAVAPRVTAVEALTDLVGPEFMPALSPDGRSLAYVAREGDDLDIFLVRVGGENPINLTADYQGSDLAPEFSPTGDRIAFASEREGGGLFVMGATGESPLRIADEGTHPSWSPDGTRLVAATEQVDDPYSRMTRSRMFIVDLADGRTHELPVGHDGVGPRWSPDGRRIAYWSVVEGRRDLWTISIDGGDPVRVTEDAHTDWEPMWAEGGNALYFHSDRGGSADLWRIPVDPQGGAATGPATPLTIGVAPVWESSISADGTRLVGAMRSTSSMIRAYSFDASASEVTGPAETLLEISTKLMQPSLSADGRMMAFRTTRPREIVTTLDLASLGRRRLTNDDFRNRGPVWSPDGSWIAMFSNRGGRYQIWLMRPEGTELRLIHDASSSDPVWSPDGTRIAVATDMDDGSPGTVFLGRDPAATTDDALWIRTGEPIVGLSCLAWSPDGRFLVAKAGYPLKLVIYDLEAGKQREYESPPADSGHTVAWLPDGERLVYWGESEQQFIVWNVQTDERIPLAGVGKRAGNPLLSPDGETLYVLEEKVDGEIWMLTMDAGSSP